MLNVDNKRFSNCNGTRLMDKKERKEIFNLMTCLTHLKKDII